MIGIKNIGKFIPESRESNLGLLDKFSTNEDFIREKIGVVNRAVKDKEQKASDLCVLAFEDLISRVKVDVEEIDCCVVVTQNPDYNIPHTAAIVHAKLELPEACAAFDISLGCSGYVYALSIVTAFMQANNLKHGLLFTSDPYSEIIDESDKNTALIFGDAATVTLLEDNEGLTPLGFDFGSKGAGYKNLINEESLYMNGRAVFGFTASKVPESIQKLLDKLSLEKSDIRKWYLHQGSKYIVDTITDRAGLDVDKVVFGMQDYGNTVSSSIPLLLADDLESFEPGNLVLLSGFGVGLSWASAVLEKK